MNKFNEFLEALTILKKYDHNGRATITAEHDEIWVYCGTAVRFKEDYDKPNEEWQEYEHYEEPEPGSIVTDGDMEALAKLGFTWDEQNEGFHTFT